MRYDLGRFRRPMRRSTEGQLMSLISLGDGSTLSLDFTAMSSLDSRFTFTRNSLATFINSQGLIQEVTAAATNDPTKARFDYNPTTFAPRGLLIEGSATNLLPWSESFATSGAATNWNWSAFNVTRGTSTQTDPKGLSSTVIKIEETSATGVHAPLIISTTSSSTTYTASVFAKAAERSYVQLFDNGGSSATAMVNLSNGTVVSESLPGITNVTALGTTGWYRISMRITTGAAQTNINFQLRLSTNGTTTSYAGTTGSGIYIWGAQLELGSGATSYIPTGSSTVQRAADDCRIDNVATSFGFNSSEGTILIQYGGRINTGSNRSYTFLPASGGTEQIFEGSGIAFNVFTSGAFVAQIGATSTIAGKVAAAYKANDFAVSVNGGAVATDTAGAVPTTITRVSIGGSAVNAAAYNNGPIIAFKYWPTRLPNATLQSLTQ